MQLIGTTTKGWGMSGASRRPDRRWLVLALILGGIGLGAYDIDVLNAVTFVVAGALVVVIFAKLVQRLYRYIRIRGFYGEPPLPWLQSVTRGLSHVPVILWRDWLLFLALVVLYTGAGASRVLGLALRDNLYWVIGTDILGLLAIGFCAYVELFEIDDPNS